MKTRLRTRKKHGKEDEAVVERLLAEEEDLRNDIWPRSFVLWAAVFYMSIYIIRPWEVLFPWLLPLRLERVWALILFVSIIFDKRSKFRLDLTTSSMVMLIALVGLSVVCSSDVSISSVRYWSFLTVIFFSIILKHAMHSLYQVTFIIGMNLLILGLYLTKSLWEFFVHGQHRYDMGVVRMTGIETTFGGPNSLAMTIVASLPLLYLLFAHRKYVAQRWPEKWRNRFRKALAYYGLIAVLSVFMTNSRSGLVTMGLFLVLRWARQSGLGRKVKVFALCLLLLAGLWMVIPQENKGRIATIWDPESGPQNAQISAQGRVTGFWAGIEMFKDSPIVGIGLGNFVSYRVENVDGVPLESHNLLGQTLGEIGGIGALGFCFFLFACFKGCSKIKKSARAISVFDVQKGTFLKALAQSYTDIIILMFAFGIFAHNFSRYNWYWCAALISSTLAAANSILKSEIKHRRKRRRAIHNNATTMSGDIR